jgi:hypothetical protein
MQWEDFHFISNFYLSKIRNTMLWLVLKENLLVLNSNNEALTWGWKRNSDEISGENKSDIFKPAETRWKQATSLRSMFSPSKIHSDLYRIPKRRISIYFKPASSF